MLRAQRDIDSLRQGVSEQESTQVIAVEKNPEKKQLFSVLLSYRGAGAGPGNREGSGREKGGDEKAACQKLRDMLLRAQRDIDSLRQGVSERESAQVIAVYKKKRNNCFLSFCLKWALVPEA